LARDAKEFAEAQSRAGRIMPASVEALATVHMALNGADLPEGHDVQAALDDLMSGMATASSLDGERVAVTAGRVQATVLPVSTDDGDKVDADDAVKRMNAQRGVKTS